MPLCISCPDMYKGPQLTTALWSHVDLMATLCDLVGIETPPTAGISQMPVLTNPVAHVRNSVLFAFDDSFLLDPAPAFNSHIRALRTPQYTYAVYFSTTNSNSPFEYELYDNFDDPLQLNNLLFAKAASMLPIWVQLDLQLQIATRDANAAPQNVVWQPPRPVG